MNMEIRQEQERVDNVMETITEQIGKLEDETVGVVKKLSISANTFGMTSRLIQILSMIILRRSLA